MKIEIVEKIDSGGFGDVWLGRDELERDVAVKIIRSASVEISSALDHAKALVKAAHPNVVKVLTIDKIKDPESDEQVDCVVMELIAGETLAKMQENSDSMKIDVRTIGSGIIDGLEHIHSQGLTHGDLHEENVMISDGHAKIIDILYLKTLSLLSTETREARKKKDLLSVRMLLVDLMNKSKAYRDDIQKFTIDLSPSSEISDIRKAFNNATNPDFSLGESKIRDNAYRKLMDDNFVDTEAYAAAVADETPQAVYASVLIKLVQDRKYDAKLKYIVREFWISLQEEDKQKVVDTLQERLEGDLPDETWWPNMRLLSRLGRQVWDALTPRVQIKLESMIVNDVLSGRSDIYNPSRGAGFLGTYASLLWPYFAKPEALIDNIEVLLNGNWYTQNYIGKHFTSTLAEVAKEPEDRKRIILGLVIALENDARLIVNHVQDLPEDWNREIAELKADRELPF